jgi:hypothetical protein
MIKFFRKIRQNMLMENKNGTYFKYAFGEIVLVVFGILIALQVSNWNQLRIEKNTMNAYYAKLANTLEDDIKVLRESYISVGSPSSKTIVFFCN